ncbi:hypothetical protein M9H77_09712 [Catharanthus roseus]|uniref:Uncharacterized protein n=1 Tax=Catharanthus roseus TaxID=4058 RepID=A0ACC0C1R0_CATRO|nr:hypothetical protein M9H77_09712 [Catharanthus roseus]
MLPDFSGNFVHVRYLSLLEDFDAIRTYSWGSCVLGFLYRQLCTAALGDMAWSRIPTLRPQLMMEIMADPLAPLGAIWCTAFDYSQLPTHTLVTYRDQLDFMPSDQFMWLPYYDRPLVPSDLWRAEVPLICYEIVEYHYPGRVMRQFAQAQMVLDLVDTHLDLHRIQLRGNDNTSWVTPHAIHVDVWNQWRVRVRDGPAVEYVEALSYPSDEYIRWYRGITRVYIGNTANRDTHAHGYQPVGVDRWMMATFPVQSSRRRPREYVPDRGTRRVKRGARRYTGREAGAGRPPVPPAPQRQEYVDPHPAVVERGEGSGGGQHYVDPFDSPHLDMPSSSLGLISPYSGFTAFQSPHPSVYGFGRFRAPPPPGTADASTPHQPISQASSSDEEEGQDALGRGHRGKHSRKKKSKKNFKFI